MFKAWATFARDYHLGDSDAVVHATHGRRLYDTLKEYCRIDDEAKLRVRFAKTLSYFVYQNFVNLRKRSIDLKTRSYKAAPWSFPEPPHWFLRLLFVTIIVCLLSSIHSIARIWMSSQLEHRYLR